jgi:hypothetical protein
LRSTLFVPLVAGRWTRAGSAARAPSGTDRSIADLAADTFESDEELEEFPAFTYAERHRDLA